MTAYGALLPLQRAPGVRSNPFDVGAAPNVGAPLCETQLYETFSRRHPPNRRRNIPKGQPV
jgi:hypothetical protein